MSKSRIKQATTEELIALKRELKNEINERVQRQQKVVLSTFANSLLAAPRDMTQSSTEDKKKAAKLLAHVDHADYDDIERMWKKHPRLMFAEVAVNDGKPNTPLKRALYNADTWTWRPFYEWIQQNQPDLVPEFFKQNDTQKEHVDLQPLNDEYALTYEKLEKFRRDEIRVVEIDRQWNELLKKQNEILPFHMVREMCRKGGGLWSPESKFDAKTAPKGGLVYDYVAGDYIKLDSNVFRSKFGSSFGLYRGYGMHPWDSAFWTSNGTDSTVGVIRDAASIQQLCKVRIAELASIPTLDQTNTFKIAPGI